MKLAPARTVPHSPRSRQCQRSRPMPPVHEGLGVPPLLCPLGRQLSPAKAPTSHHVHDNSPPRNSTHKVKCVGSLTIISAVEGKAIPNCPVSHPTLTQSLLIGLHRRRPHDTLTCYANRRHEREHESGRNTCIASVAKQPSISAQPKEFVRAAHVASTPIPSLNGARDLAADSLPD